MSYVYTFQGIGLIIALVIGICLLVLRPYWAFLFATFLVIALSIRTLTQDLGAFFTLDAASLLISIFAFIMDIERKMVLPGPAIAMLTN